MSFPIPGYLSDGPLYAINMGMCAMNLAESAGEAINRETLAEVYVTQALSIKTCFPKVLHYAAVSINIFAVEVNS